MLSVTFYSTLPGCLLFCITLILCFRHVENYSGDTQNDNHMFVNLNVHVRVPVSVLSLKVVSFLDE